MVRKKKTKNHHPQQDKEYRKKRIHPNIYTYVHTYKQTDNHTHPNKQTQKNTHTPETENNTRPREQTRART